MFRFLMLAFLFVSVGLGRPVAAQTAAADGLPPRPAPFQFVNDQAQLLAPADAKKLESGLRRYADNTGTQVVVVTVPTLGGRDVADYGRALGTAWGVGQRDKNNGVVVLVSAKEHKVTVQAGNGLKNTITPAVTRRIIGEMTPSFKRGNYFAGLRTGLNTLMVTANPDSNPQKNGAAQVGDPATAAGVANAPAPANVGATAGPAPLPEPAAPMAAAPEPAPSGPGLGTLLLGALVIGGGLWLVLRMFRSRSTANGAANYPPANPPNAAPNFLPNRPTGPAPAGGYGPGQPGPGNYGNNYGGGPNAGGGMMDGMGGILATGAAAAAGAYLGNRMASGHDTAGNNLAGGGSNFTPDSSAGVGLAGAGGPAAAGDYFAARDGGATADTPAPDYFSADDSANSASSDYFSDDNSSSSYDDTSSADTGGGGFDGGSGDSGSW